MTVLHPILLAWAAALIVPIVLYLVHHRPQRRRVSTLIFFKTLAQEHQESPWLRRLKRMLSLLLTLLIIAAAVAAMAQFIIAPRGDDARQIVILVDRSASMSGVDGDGVARLDAALASIDDRLAAIPHSVGVSVIAYDNRPEILLARSLDRREVARTLRSIRAMPIEDAPAQAMRLARQVASIETPAAIWHATDRPDDPENETEPPDTETEASDNAVAEDASEPDIRVSHWNFAADQPINVGISGFALRRMPMQRDRFEAFIQVHAVGPEPIKTEVEVRIDGRVAALRKLIVEPGGHQQLLLPVGAGDGSTMRVQLGGVDDDALALDDRVDARIPPLKPIRVLWITPEPDPFTELALAALGQDTHIRIFQGGPDAYPPAEPVDVLLFQNWMPEQLPADTPVVAINPPSSVGTVAIRPLDAPGLPLLRMRVTDPKHPLLLGVATGRLETVQTAVIGVDALRTGIEPLWVGEAGPVLAAGESDGRRLVVMAIDPGRSTALPLLPSFPLLIGNAIYWSTESNDALEAGPNYRAGQLIEVDSDELQWLSDRKGESTPQPVLDGWVRLDRLGLFEAKFDVSGSASLLSSRESLLADAGGTDRSGRPTRVGWLTGDLTLALLWAMVIALVIDSYLFHVRTVY